MAGPLYNPNGTPQVGYVLPPGVTRGRILAEQMRKRQEELTANKATDNPGPYSWDVNNPVSPNYSPNTFDQAQAAADGYQSPQQPQAPNAPEQFSTTEPRDQGAAYSSPDSTASFSGVEGEDQWTSTGKTDTFGSWFNKPQASDALTAFGAAMLKAPTFLEGLGDAALAVNKVDREYRMPTEEEIARANMKARIASGRGAFSPKIVQTGYDGNGNPVTQMMKGDGSVVWLDNTNQEMPGPPQGFVRSQDSGQGKMNSLNATDIQKDDEAAKVAMDQMDDLNEMERLAEGANIGPGWPEQTARFLTKVSGVDFGGTSLDQMQEFQKISKNGELLKAMEQRGLGQFTEMERKIVQEALVTIETDPKAAKAIAAVMKVRAQRSIDMADDWAASGLAPHQYRSWRRKWLKDWSAENGSVYSSVSKPKSDASSSKSIIDEADAIVDGK